MKRIIVGLGAVGMLLIGAVGQGKADMVLYTQPTTLNGAFSSQNDTNSFGNFATVYDNFTLATSATVNSVQWVGSYFNPPAQGPITGYTLTFWSDNAGQPGVALASESIPGTANETSIGLDNVGDPAFTYSTNLPNPFSAAAGTQYWLSIVPDLGFPPQWGWEVGTGGDGIAFQDFFGGRSQVGSDLSFTLNGTTTTTVPEPASLALIGIAGVSLIGYGWRRRLLQLAA